MSYKTKRLWEHNIIHWELRTNSAFILAMESLVIKIYIKSFKCILAFSKTALRAPQGGKFNKI